MGHCFSIFFTKVSLLLFFSKAFRGRDDKDIYLKVINLVHFSENKNEKS